MSVLRRPKSLEDAGITHIVRALNGDGSGMPEELYKSLQIDIDDLDDENIIQHFGKANRFIRGCLLIELIICQTFPFLFHHSKSGEIAFQSWGLLNDEATAQTLYSDLVICHQSTLEDYLQIRISGTGRERLPTTNS
jgi:hypothetical protein